MKKIINGKLYDTDKAKQLGTWSNNHSPSDFSYVEETLYQKRTGEYFLYGYGGPNTKYSVSQGQNTWSGGEKIMPVEYSTAKSWAEEHLDADEYIQLFGDPETNDSKTQICLSISSSSVEKARRQAAINGMSLSAYIESLL